MLYNIVFLDSDTVGEVPALDKIRALGNCAFYPHTAPEHTLERVKDAHIIITNKVVLNAQTLQQLPHLKLVCITATGTNNVDLEYAQANGIKVKNVAGYSTESVVMCTYSMLLALKTRTAQYDDYVKSGEYAGSPIFCHLGDSFNELFGKTMGIIGLGTIGKRVAEVASAFGMQVVYHSPSGHPQPEVKYRHLLLNELLGTCDVVSVHAPLNTHTSNLIGLEQLKLMKKEAVLLNAGRGGIINEKDLCTALNEGILAGAGLDVFEKEPLPGNNPLLSVNDRHRLVLMPHVAWSAVEARERLMHTIAGYIEEAISAEG